jgi:hypothetical protein
MAVTVFLPKLPRYPKSAYIGVPAHLRVRTSPSKRGWGPGWPECSTDRSNRGMARSVRARDGATFNRPVRKELVEHVSFLMQETQDIAAALGGDVPYEFRKAKETDGGVSSWVCRPIKNSNPPVASVHSYGAAIDIDSRSNPMSKRWMATNPPWMVELWAAGDFYWGGWFSNTAWFFDAMHFEYNLRPSDVAGSLARARAAAKRIRTELGLNKPIPEDNVTTDQVKTLQATLNTLGAKLLVDGIYGPLTDAALKAAQGRAGVLVTAEKELAAIKPQLESAVEAARIEERRRAAAQVAAAKAAVALRLATLERDVAA